MKRRNATILTAGSILMLGGYVAWCSRTFYLKPAIQNPLWMPPEVMADIPEAAEEAGLMEPEEFNLRKFFGYLSSPYEKRTGLRLDVSRPAEDAIVVRRDSTLIWGFTGPTLHYIRRAGRWRQVGALEYQEFRSRWNVDPWKKSTPPKDTPDLMGNSMS